MRNSNLHPQERFNQLLCMDMTERKKAIKDMMPDERTTIMQMMNLPKNCTQKKLCASIEIIKQLVEKTE